MTVINIIEPTTGLRPEYVRGNVIDWAGENGIEVEVLNELLDVLGLDHHAEWVEVEVTLTALVRVRVTSEMAASDVLDNQTYERLEFNLNVSDGGVDGVAEVEVEDISNIAIEGVEATDE